MARSRKKLQWYFEWDYITQCCYYEQVSRIDDKNEQKLQDQEIPSGERILGSDGGFHSEVTWRS